MRGRRRELERTEYLTFNEVIGWVREREVGKNTGLLSGRTYTVRVQARQCDVNLIFSSENVVDLAKSQASEQSSHLPDHTRIGPFRLYVNLSHWMLRVHINLVHAGQQLDRAVDTKPGPRLV